MIKNMIMIMIMIQRYDNPRCKDTTTIKIQIYNNRKQEYKIQSSKIQRFEDRMIENNIFQCNSKQNNGNKWLLNGYGYQKTQFLSFFIINLL